MNARSVPQLAMSVQRIKRTDPSTDGQGGKQFASFGNLIGFFAHCQLSPDFLALMGEAGKQMGRILFLRAGSSHGLAIDGERIGGRGVAGRPDPCGEYLFDNLGII